MSGIIKPIAVEPIKHIHSMLTNREYFTYHSLWSKLRNLPRYQECRVRVNGYDLLIPDALSFLYSYQEIFLERLYEFKASNQTPKILDLGANIGLSVLFFKHLYPQAEITAFEADAKVFDYLKKNVCDNGFNDVRLFNKAVWHENTTLKFVSEGADGGHISDEREDRENSVLEIEAVDIADILQGDRFDFIKMDIEGAEAFVVPRCRDLLDRTKHIFIEYHSRVGQEQHLDKILTILSEGNFRVHIRNVMKKNIAPFVELKPMAGFDLQLNIFAWQEK
ncbi:FkbM family methyltransferase [Myxosarcina sp. GI1]|uniref:FkbM family methyltransferase n=1 Tax=Myxosarcina sp. GI1 TaxID=1541065 RepID=UPI0006917C69|nr:FkbM family methyltransferase [Myxosarcina sp. GI1]